LLLDFAENYSRPLGVDGLSFVKYKWPRLRRELAVVCRELVPEIFRDGGDVVRPFAEARDVLFHKHPRGDVRSEDVFFIEKQDKGRFGEERVADDVSPELERVLDTVDLRILVQTLPKSQRRQEQNRLNIVKVRYLSKKCPCSVRIRPGGSEL